MGRLGRKWRNGPRWLLRPPGPCPWSCSPPGRWIAPLRIAYPGNGFVTVAANCLLFIAVEIRSTLMHDAYAWTLSERDWSFVRLLFSLWIRDFLSYFPNWRTAREQVRRVAFLLTIAESHPRDDRNLSTEADRYAKTAEGKIRDRRYYFAFDVASRKSRIGGIYCYTLPIYRRVTLGGVSMREVNTGQTISCYALANIDGWLRDALGNNGILTIF